MPTTEDMKTLCSVSKCDATNKRLTQTNFVIALQAEARADLESQLASLKERCVTLQRENEQNEKSLEELDTQHQEAVGKTPSEQEAACFIDGLLRETMERKDKDKKSGAVLGGKITKACCVS